MSRRRSSSVARRLLLVLAIIVLGVVLLRTRMILSEPQTETFTPAVGISPTSSLPSDEIFTTLDAISSIQPADVGGFETPADPWANSVLNQAIILLGQQSGSSAGLSWWDREGSNGVIGWEEDTFTLDDEIVNLAGATGIEVYVEDPSNQDRLYLIGSAQPESGALLLSIHEGSFSQIQERWLLSNGTFLLSLRALVTQSRQRDLTVTASYTQGTSSILQIVLLKAIKVNEDDSTLTPTLWTTVTPTITPRASLTVTPTRAPEAYLGTVVAAQIDPVMFDIMSINSSITQGFIDRHPWAGVLASTEQGIKIGGRTTAVSRATELTFYLLEDGTASGGVSRLFTVEFTVDGTTRFPDDQVLFQAHRMEEILYWMVIRAAESGGQIVVAYDDFGIRQSITIIGFKPF